MTRRVRGEQPLPMATDPALPVGRDSLARRLPRASAYLAISVQVTDDGGWRVHRIRLDRASGRILTERLDGGRDAGPVGRHMAEVLAYWATEAAGGALDT